MVTTYRGPAIWSVLERYYALRSDIPITSPLGRINTGGPDQVNTGDCTAKTAFLCDVGTALAGLTRPQREQIELYYVEHRAWIDADARRRNATNDVYRKHSGIEQLLAQRSKREWRRIADIHQAELHRIRQRRAYKDAMIHLEISLPIVLLLGGHSGT